MEYRLLKVPELKRELLRRGLNSIGTRRELTARLEEHDAAESQKSKEAADMEDVEILEIRSVDFDLYGGVKNEGEDIPSDAALQDLLQSSLAESAESAESTTDLPPETKKVLPRKRTAEVKEVKGKVLPKKKAEVRKVQRVLPRKRATQVATQKAPVERVEDAPGAALKRLLRRMDSYGTYDDLIMRLHATLKPCEVSGENPREDHAFEGGEGPEAALEAAWGKANEMVPSEPAEVEPEEVPVPPDTGDLELKVQQAMRRTARAQMQLRRKKAEELMLMGLLKHCEAACNVYREDGKRRVRPQATLDPLSGRAASRFSAFKPP